MDSKEAKIYTAILITSIILGVIILFFIISIIRHQRRNQLLYKSKIQAEITTLEKERARIAADLHDELGPLLSATKLRINILEVNSDEDLVQLDKINKHIDDIIQRMREISNDLMPQALLSRSVVIAMEEFIHHIIKPAGLKIDFKHENIPELPGEKAINLYRIMQEIIHNTIKHSKATELKIELTTNHGILILITKDNGKGFDYNNLINENRGLGLRNLLSRTEVMGGQMYIESKNGKGTQYIFEIPVSDSSEG